MRFDLPESIEAMREGRKTQTRRRSTYWLKKQPGSRITIVHKGKLLGWATVIRAYRQRVVDMTPTEVRAEGYKAWIDFNHALWELYPDDQPGLPFLEMTAIEFGDIKWKETP